ncbi:phosphate acetyltransferase [Pontimonas sp.]|nr:phosphate acetyltransferase [Pontimonas sp.]
MATSVYVSSAEGSSGKSTVALGLLDALRAQVERVGVFRPVTRSSDDRDYVLEMLLDHDGVNLTYSECIGVTYEDVRDDAEAALSVIVERFRAIESRCDAVVIVGSDYTGVGNPTEFSFNARVAANLGAPVVLVVTGREPTLSAGRDLALPARPLRDIVTVTDAALDEIKHSHATPLAVVVNRADGEQLSDIRTALHESFPALPLGVIPEDTFLVSPTVAAVMESLDGQLLHGDPELLTREALGVMVGAMSLEHIVERLREGFVVLVPGDRTDAIVGVLAAHRSDQFPSLAALVLYGGFELSETVLRLMQSRDDGFPIISTHHDTYESVLHVMSARGKLAADSQRKYDTALQLFHNNVDTEAVLEQLNISRATVVTPLMFQYTLLERAGALKKHIVLPEGLDDRIIRATATLLSRNTVDVTLLGDEFQIRSRASELGLDIASARIISPTDPTLVERFSEEYAALRAHKGVTVEAAREIVSDVSYFGTMMVHLGLVDGMVSGAAHTTAHTITPSFEIIKTAPGVSIVSSVFLMCLADRVLVYGDCAIVPDPSAEQLADIAVSATATARLMGIEPRVAMLSYSTGESGSGADVDKVRQATALVRERQPGLLLDGPIQYDAAIVPSVAEAKMPGSALGGDATVFIFPDLNTGNNTYKAVQRSAGAVAIGPVLQGLAKPVNDLSRGATVKDIINTVAITAIQAQGITP